MSLAELFPLVQNLPHQDKLCLLQFLASDLAQDEGLPNLKAGSDFEIWSPHGAFEAAQTLQEALLADDENR